MQQDFRKQKIRQKQASVCCRDLVVCLAAMALMGWWCMFCPSICISDALFPVIRETEQKEEKIYQPEEYSDAMLRKILKSDKISFGFSWF